MPAEVSPALQNLELEGQVVLPSLGLESGTGRQEKAPSV
jgi:hypothetical protein